MLEGNRGAYVPPDGGESVWLVGDRITVKLTSEDTGGVYSVAEEISPPQGGAPPHTHTVKKKKRCMCWRVRSSSCSARTPSRRAQARASTSQGAPCTPGAAF